MLFVVNDMGFASDGRFLDRASMDAGSAGLKDLDGNLHTGARVSSRPNQGLPAALQSRRPTQG
jgi:hypothetical protein